MSDYKPVLLIGNGMRGNPEAVDRLQALGIPALYTWMACDMGAEDDPTFCGRPGIVGQRAANIIQQKATHLYCYGARLDGEQVFYDYNRFAPNAQKFIYDIDCAELKKFPADWHCFNKIDELPIFDPIDPAWLAWCRALYVRFRPELDGADAGKKYVDPFTFIRLLSEAGKPLDVFAIGSSGNAPTTFYQTFKVKAGQRVMNACTIGAMGADIPMALGAAVAGGRRTICVTGDGGFQLNAQELETVRRGRWPITFFVFSNNGYASIRNNQKIRFDGRVTGADPASGLTIAPIEELAGAYRIPYFRLDGSNLDAFERCFEYAPMIVEVMIDPDWAQFPRAMAHMGADGTFQNDDMADMTPKIDDLKELMA